MTNKQFIDKMVTERPSQTKQHGSILCDRGNLYSYGYHYPLLVEVNGYRFLNDSGYSHSTSKHIGLASGWADYRCHFKSSGRGYSELKEDIIEQVNEDIKDLQSQIMQIKRQNTQKEQNLKYRLNQLLEAQNKLIN